MDIFSENAQDLVRIPGPHDKVYKDECMYCFCDGQNDRGLFINLFSFQSFCCDHLELDREDGRRGTLYLVVKRCLKSSSDDDNANSNSKDIIESTETSEKLAYDFSKHVLKDEIEETYEIGIWLPGEGIHIVPYDESLAPEMLRLAVVGIQSHDSASDEALADVWEEERRVSKYAANLPLLPADRQISMDASTWRCDFTGATENLWLNLSTGKIGSGRPHFDGTGGNGAALRHFEETGKNYPLAVKLGTITATSADVYSYASDEDDMVIDPLLKEHLAHWGIDMTQMTKTEKTMAELQHEKNIMFEFDAITEAGSELEPISGRGFLGLKNLGNSCYMNSVLQTMWSIPELKPWYVDNAKLIYSNSKNANPADDLLCQFTKIGSALVDQPCKCRPEQPTSVSPLSFKTIAGKGHPEFSSGRQQDTDEYFRYLLEGISRAELFSNIKSKISDAPIDIKSLFSFSVEDRIESRISHEVQYIYQKDVVLSLQIPFQESSVKDDESQRKRQKLKGEEQTKASMECLQDLNSTSGPECTLPSVSLSECISHFAAEQELEGYDSVGQAVKTTRMASFPPYLMIHLRRYYIGEDWTPMKMEVLVDIPEKLCLEDLKARGPQPGEKLKKDENNGDDIEVDDSVVAQLASTGFPESKCRRAARETNNNIELAMEWLLSHIDDSLDDEEKGTQGLVDPNKVAELEAMGFSKNKANIALVSCDGDITRAIDWLFSHEDEDGIANEQDPSVIGEGVGEYELIGFISHIGKNTSCGHYVCHLKKNGRWTIFNDEKVALSKSPPFEFGYMYLFRRCDIQSEHS